MGVVFVGQAVPDRHLGGVGKLLHNSLAEAAVLDTVKHRSKHPGRIGDRFLFADLAARRVKVGRAPCRGRAPQPQSCTGCGWMFFSKISATFLPRSPSCGMPAFFWALSFAASESRGRDLLRRIVKQGQEVPSFESTDIHCVFPPAAMRSKLHIHTINMYSYTTLPRFLQGPSPLGKPKTFCYNSCIVRASSSAGQSCRLITC